MRFLVPALLALPAVGCVYASATPRETVEVELLDAKSRPLEEAWALTWTEDRRCYFGCVLFNPHGGVILWPEWEGVSDVRLQRITPARKRLTLPEFSERYVQWGFLILPPGSYCESKRRWMFFAPDCPWGFEGYDKPWSGKLLAGARLPDDPRWPMPEADPGRADRIEAVLDALADASERDEVRAFAALLLRNIEAAGGHSKRRVIEKLEVLTK